MRESKIKKKRSSFNADFPSGLRQKKGGANKAAMRCSPDLGRNGTRESGLRKLGGGGGGGCFYRKKKGRPANFKLHSISSGGSERKRQFAQRRHHLNEKQGLDYKGTRKGKTEKKE